MPTPPHPHPSLCSVPAYSLRECTFGSWLKKMNFCLARVCCLSPQFPRLVKFQFPKLPWVLVNSTRPQKCDVSLGVNNSCIINCLELKDGYCICNLQYTVVEPQFWIHIFTACFTAGTNTHSVDFRKSAGGFIHGYRYTGICLFCCCCCCCFILSCKWSK